tara:strand:+ start:848 stop:1105 length:258 start_codon:yes stop_codon:yes gene_type:complete
MSDKINIDLDKVESSMSSIMGQMGLGVNIKSGGSKKVIEGGGGKGRDKTPKKDIKKSEKPSPPKKNNPAPAKPKPGKPQPGPKKP